jgi:hypothetical protein
MAVLMSHGGPNINPPVTANYVTQHCPYQYSASQTLLTEIEVGLPDKLGTTGESVTCSFELWMHQQTHQHVKFGLDTPYLIPNDTWTLGINLFQCFNKTYAVVAPWIHQLTETAAHHFG